MNGAHTIGFTIIREAKLRGGDVALKYSQAVCARAVQSTCLGPIVYYIPDVLFAEKVRRHESGSCQRPLYSRTYPARERNDAFYRRDSLRLVLFPLR